MVRVAFRTTANGITAFWAEGHSGFAAAGEDVVCAAISALTQAAVLGLCEVASIAVSVVVNDGFLHCELPGTLTDEQWHDSQVILQTLRKSLVAVAIEHEGFLTIEEVP